MTSFAFRETPVQVPTWFMGIVDKYVPEDQRALAIQDYAVACRQARKPLTPRQHEIYSFLAGHLAERDTIRMNIKTLESRADVSAKVEISASMARVIAGQLQRLLEETG